KGALVHLKIDAPQGVDLLVPKAVDSFNFFEAYQGIAHSHKSLPWFVTFPTSFMVFSAWARKPFPSSLGPAGASRSLRLSSSSGRSQGRRGLRAWRHSAEDRKSVV